MRVLNQKCVLENHCHEIKQLLQEICDKENVDMHAAAFSLAHVFSHFNEKELNEFIERNN
jgi:thymidine phosphorylase